jgi:hypothetical protein
VVCVDVSGGQQGVNFAPHLTLCRMHPYSMPTCISRASEIGFTLVPYTLHRSIEDVLKEHRADTLLGYVSLSKETGIRSFTYVESGKSVVLTDH